MIAREFTKNGKMMYSAIDAGCEIRRAISMDILDEQYIRNWILPYYDIPYNTCIEIGFDANKKYMWDKFVK